MCSGFKTSPQGATWDAAVSGAAGAGLVIVYLLSPHHPVNALSGYGPGPSSWRLARGAARQLAALDEGCRLELAEVPTAREVFPDVADLDESLLSTVVRLLSFL